MHVIYRFFLICSVGFVLQGCAGESRLFQESVSAVLQSEKFNDLTLTQKMNPNYAYLRLNSPRGAILMLWGYIDKDELSNQPIDVWYSGDREVIKLQEGRVVATGGLSNDWLAARYQSLPSWSSVVTGPVGSVSRYSRSIDFKNDYKFNQIQTVELSRIEKPKSHYLLGVPLLDVAWFEEKSSSSKWQPSVYAVVPNWLQTNQPKVVYTWHCFGVNDCFSLQVWTADDQAALVAANLAASSKVTKP
jgi:hypothetical protein